MWKVVKKEVLRLPHVGVIYPMQDSDLVMLVQVVSKKGANNRSMLLFTSWVRTSRAKSVVTMDIRGTTAPKPVKTAPTSTTTTTTDTVHNKEARGGTSHVHHFREVIITTLLSIQISIQTNLP